MRILSFFAVFLFLATAGAILDNDCLFVAAPIVAVVVFLLWPTKPRKNNSTPDKEA